jgi:tRNA pseudouridine13 synthase
VEELPLYEPCGEGEHLYLEVEARDLTTDATAELVARACKVPRRAVSFAGRKDRRAVTRQWFSVHGTHEAEPQVEDDRAVILHGARHRNRLRRGHLRGNRFALRLELEAEAAAEVGSDLQQIAQLGLENEFGPQRFGRGGSTLRAAIELARGSAAAAVEILIDPKGRWSLGSPLPTGGGEGLTRRMRAALERHADDAEGALRAAGAELTRLLASAAQAEIFNRVLAARRAAGRLHVLRTGDVARRGLGRPFLARA